MTEESYTGWYFHWIEQWSQFWDSCNWYTFHPIKLEIEDESHMGGWEVTFVLMGLGFRVRYNYQETEVVKGLKEQIERIKSGTLETKPWGAWEFEDAIKEMDEAEKNNERGSE